MPDLTIANTVCDLILGDVREHLPLEKIPLEGDVLGLGTTTSVDNGELTFLRNGDQQSAIWRCVAHDGSIVRLTPGDGSGHFPYVCFTGDARALRRPVDLEILGDPEGRPLQGLVEDAIAQGQRLGTLEAVRRQRKLVRRRHEVPSAGSSATPGFRKVVTPVISTPGGLRT